MSPYFLYNKTKLFQGRSLSFWTLCIVTEENNFFLIFFSAITIGVRILGPALGFIVGSLCTSVYADLSIDPKIDTTDPRWVGAWWLGNSDNKLFFFCINKNRFFFLGLVIISGLLILASFAMFAFPKRLSTARPTPRIHRNDRKHPRIRGISNGFFCSCFNYFCFQTFQRQLRDYLRMIF